MRRKLTILLFLSLTILSQAGLKKDPRLIKGVLPNGLTYYIYPNDFPKGEAVYRLFIKSGSVFETEEQRGLAHFIEHMAFNGTTHFPGDGIVRFLESKGAKFGVDLNAYTSFNETVYKLQLPTTDLSMVDSTLLILSDWANGLLLDSMEIDKERGVIYSEWLSKTGPERDAQNAFLMELLNGSRFADRIVIGDTSVILGFPHPLLKDYYARWYHPSRMAIAISGDVDPKQVKSLIKKHFGWMDESRAVKAPEYGIPLYQEPKLTVVSHASMKKIEFSRIQLLPAFKPVHSMEAFQELLKRAMLNRLFTARLNTLSFEDQPYKNGSASVSSFLNATGVLLASAELIPGRETEGVLRFNEQLEQMRRYGFLNIEIEKAKKIFLKQLQRRAASKAPVASENFMNDLYANFYTGQQMITPKEEYRLAAKYVPTMDSLTFVNLLKTTVNPTQTHYFITTFEEKKKVFSDEKRFLATLDSLYSSPLPPYQRKIEVPDELLAELPEPGKVVKRDTLQDIATQRIQLSNGVTVYYRKSLSDKGRISLSGFREGGAYALDSTEFVSAINSGNIVGMSGAGAFSRDALSYFLAGNSASVRLLTDKNRSGIVAGSEKEDVETLFQLLYLKWTEPRIDTTVFEQVKRQSIEAYRTQNRTDSKQYYQDLQYLLNGRNYVTRELTDSILEKELILDKMIPAFGHYFGAADGYTFILISDEELSTLEPYILQYLGGLPTGEVRSDYVYQGSPKLTQDSVFIRKAGDSPKASVSLIYQGNSIGESMLGFDLKNELMVTVLRTNLLKSLREELGMVYSVSVSASGTLHPDDLFRTSVSFSCKPKDVDTLILRTREIILSFVQDPSSMASVLDDARKNLIKQHALDIQKDAYWSSFLRNSLYNSETDWSFANEYTQRVMDISPEKLAEHLKKMMLRVPQVNAVLLPKPNQQ